MKQGNGNPLDLRAWLDTARALGELKDVRGADEAARMDEALRRPRRMAGKLGIAGL